MSRDQALREFQRRLRAARARPSAATVQGAYEQAQRALRGTTKPRTVAAGGEHPPEAGR